MGILPAVFLWRKYEIHQSRTLKGSIFYAAFFAAKYIKALRFRSGKGQRMQPEIVVAICSLIGTLVGSLAGIMTANKLTTYRIEQLEEKVKKHNNLVERMVVVEQSTRSAHHRIEGIEKEVRHEE